MSGIALVFHRDGSPASSVELEGILGLMAHRGRDGRHMEVSGPVALGAQLWWSTPGDVGVGQPVWSEHGRTALVFDGRIDNRETVLDTLGAASFDGARSAVSDPQLVLAAHDRWGDDCFARLVGEFALALYEADTRRVLIVRDQLGDRTLFYHLGRDVLVVASEEHAVASHAAVSDALDESMLALHLAAVPSSAGATYFRDVREVMPAQTLVVRSDDSSSTQYWSAAPVPTLRGLTDEDYAERYRHLLRQAVRSRLRTVSPVAVQMSGGYDSTSVAALAAGELAERGARLRTYSWVFEKLTECDESHYIDAASGAMDLDSVRFAGDDAWSLRDWRTLPHHPGQPDWNMYRPLKARLHALAHDDGHDVLLTGVFGNHIYCGWEHHIADLLVDLRARDAIISLRETARRTGLSRAVTGPWSRRVAGRVLDSLPGARRVRPRRVADFDPWWLRPEARCLVLEDTPWPPNLADTQRPEQHHAVAGSATAFSAAHETPLASRRGVELRNPYRDLRFVEFMLAIPAYQLYNAGRLKYIAHAAMRGLLPNEILRRRDFTSIARLHRLGLRDRESSEFERLIETGRDLWGPFISDQAAAHLAAGDRDDVIPEAEMVRWQCAGLAMWRERNQAAQTTASTVDRTS